MAARLTKRQTDNCREAIQSTRLINKLQCFVFDEEWERVGVPVFDSVKAGIALGLLKKTVPDQKVTELDLGGAQLTVNLVHQSGNKPTDDHS